MALARLPFLQRLFEPTPCLNDQQKPESQNWARPSGCGSTLDDRFGSIRVLAGQGRGPSNAQESACPISSACRCCPACCWRSATRSIHCGGRHGLRPRPASRRCRWRRLWSHSRGASKRAEPVDTHSNGAGRFRGAHRLRDDRRRIRLAVRHRLGGPDVRATSSAPAATARSTSAILALCRLKLRAPREEGSPQVRQ